MRTYTQFNHSLKYIPHCLLLAAGILVTKRQRREQLSCCVVSEEIHQSHCSPGTRIYLAADCIHLEVRNEEKRVKLPLNLVRHRYMRQNFIWSI